MPFQIVAITNRTLCREPLPRRIMELCNAGIDRVIVREKDLTSLGYEQLLKEIWQTVSSNHHQKITVNTFTDIARKEGVFSIQIPFAELKEHPELVHEFATIGVSIHSVAEVTAASRLGATYCIAGHIFPTSCKAGLAPRGLDFLREACAVSTIPVYAIGGIGEENITAVQEAGASGACIMSGLMACEDPAETLQHLRKIIDPATCCNKANNIR